MRVFSQINNCQQKQNKKTKQKTKQKTDKTKRGALLLGLAKSIYYCRWLIGQLSVAYRLHIGRMSAAYRSTHRPIYFCIQKCKIQSMTSFDKFCL